MNGLIFICSVIAIFIVWYELAESAKVQYRPGCQECARHKAEEAEKEKRRQEQLAREYETRYSHRQIPPGAGEGEGESKRPPGGWAV